MKLSVRNLIIGSDFETMGTVDMKKSIKEGQAKNLLLKSSPYEVDHFMCFSAQNLISLQPSRQQPEFQVDLSGIGGIEDAYFVPGSSYRISLRCIYE